MNEADDDKYVSIGYGRYKEKGKEDDDNADVYVKTDSGKFVKSSDQKSDDDGGEKPQPSGAGLKPSDFERDFDNDANRAADDEADDMDRDARFDADAETGSIAGNEDAIDFAQALAQGNETNRSYQGLKDAGHEDLAKAIYNADSEEEKFDLVRKASEESDEPESKSDEPKSGSDKSDGEPTGSKEEIKKAKEELAQAQEYYDESKEELKMTQDPHDEERVRKYVAADFEELQRAKKKLAKLQGAKKESITINGKQYRPIKESKKFNKRVLKENYDRIFRSLK